jgi:hypothetical protein
MKIFTYPNRFQNEIRDSIDALWREKGFSELKWEFVYDDQSSSLFVEPVASINFYIYSEDLEIRYKEYFRVLERLDYDDEKAQKSDFFKILNEFLIKIELGELEHFVEEKKITSKISKTIRIGILTLFLSFIYYLFRINK